MTERRARTPIAMAEIAQAATPMMRQYLETKARYPDALLFFRLGDFYELFFEDALTASEALQITLTARAKGDDKVPMCGVPHHAARGYVAKLLERGFKVAICDQVEEPGKSAIVKREVTRVVTPGMVLDDQVLDPREAAYVGAVALGAEAGGGLAPLDASTGELVGGEVASRARLVEELVGAAVPREELTEALRPVGALERLLSPLVLKQGNARDLRALAGALVALPRLEALLAARSAPLLR